MNKIITVCIGCILLMLTFLTADVKEKRGALKEERQNEIKTMKADFAGRREVIMKKYVGGKHENSAVKPSYVPPAVKNIPDQKKDSSKDKKKNRKS